MNFDYDYLIVGSGFGGAVSALRLAEKGYGRFLRATLPPFPLTREFSRVEGFFAAPGAP